MKKTYKVSTLLIIFLLVVTALGQVITPAKAAVGFRINGRNLVDVNGNNFIMRGINHAHAWYPGNTASFADIKNVGKANTVRVVLSGGRWGANSASDVANIITLCKNNKLVCVLENHDTTGYQEDGAATSLAAAVNYWNSIKSVLVGQENWVIINIGNEPWGNNNYANWTQETQNAIIAMRNNGFQHTLMVDAPTWGQDWPFIMRDNAPSVFASDPQRNTIFSIHMYGVFDTAAEVQAYISSFVSRGLPLVIGEFGDNHSDGNPDENAIMSQAQSNGIGYIGWSWSGNGSGVEYLDMVTGFNASQITSWGNRLINGANGLSSTAVQCTCYSGGANPTATRTHTPVPGQPTATRTRTPTPGGPTPTRSSTPGSGGVTVLYNFESGSSQSWAGINIKAGPWSITEWAANGSYSLKADVDLGDRYPDLHISAAQNFTGKSALKVSVKHASWGNMGSGMTAKIFIKTGSGYTWYDSGSVNINSSGATVLTLNLSGVANLNDVKELGVQFHSPSNSSGQSAIYVDYVTVQ